jgi:hypothetical protein
VRFILLGMADKDSVGELGVIKVPPGALTTPCTLLALHNWLAGAHAVAPGVGAAANVTSTATSIGVT